MPTAKRQGPGVPRSTDQRIPPGIVPDVYGYTDPVKFVCDTFRALKKADKQFSHRNFAARLGFRSSGFLHHVMTRRCGLRPATARKFGRIVGLTAAGVRYLGLLAAAAAAARAAQSDRGIKTRISVQRPGPKATVTVALTAT